MRGGGPARDAPCFALDGYGLYYRVGGDVFYERAGVSQRISECLPPSRVIGASIVATGEEVGTQARGPQRKGIQVKEIQAAKGAQGKGTKAKGTQAKGGDGKDAEGRRRRNNSGAGNPSVEAQIWEASASAPVVAVHVPHQLVEKWLPFLTPQGEDWAAIQTSASQNGTFFKKTVFTAVLFKRPMEPMLQIVLHAILPFASIDLTSGASHDPRPDNGEGEDEDDYKFMHKHEGGMERDSGGGLDAGRRKGPGRGQNPSKGSHGKDRTGKRPAKEALDVIVGEDGAWSSLDGQREEGLSRSGSKGWRGASVSLASIRGFVSSCYAGSVDGILVAASGRENLKLVRINVLRDILPKVDRLDSPFLMSRLPLLEASCAHIIGTGARNRSPSSRARNGETSGALREQLGPGLAEEVEGAEDSSSAFQPFIEKIAMSTSHAAMLVRTERGPSQSRPGEAAPSGTVLVRIDWRDELSHWQPSSSPQTLNPHLSKGRDPRNGGMGEKMKDERMGDEDDGSSMEDREEEPDGDGELGEREEGENEGEEEEGEEGGDRGRTESHGGGSIGSGRLNVLTTMVAVSSTTKDLVAVAVDEERICVSDVEGRLVWIDLRTGQQRTVHWHNHGLRALLLLPNGTTIAGGEKGLISRYSPSLERTTIIRNLPSPIVSAFALPSHLMQILDPQLGAAYQRICTKVAFALAHNQLVVADISSSQICDRISFLPTTCFPPVPFVVKSSKVAAGKRAKKAAYSDPELMDGHSSLASIQIFPDPYGLRPGLLNEAEPNEDETSKGLSAVLPKAAKKARKENKKSKDEEGLKTLSLSESFLQPFAEDKLALGGQSRVHLGGEPRRGFYAVFYFRPQVTPAQEIERPVMHYVDLKSMRAVAELECPLSHTRNEWSRRDISGWRTFWRVRSMAAHPELKALAQVESQHLTEDVTVRHRFVRWRVNFFAINIQDQMSHQSDQFGQKDHQNDRSGVSMRPPKARLISRFAAPCRVTSVAYIPLSFPSSPSYESPDDTKECGVPAEKEEDGDEDTRAKAEGQVVSEKNKVKLEKGARKKERRETEEKRKEARTSENSTQDGCLFAVSYGDTVAIFRWQQQLLFRRKETGEENDRRRERSKERGGAEESFFWKEEGFVKVGQLSFTGESVRQVIAIQASRPVLMCLVGDRVVRVELPSVSHLLNKPRILLTLPPPSPHTTFTLQGLADHPQSLRENTKDGGANTDANVKGSTSRTTTSKTSTSHKKGKAKEEADVEGENKKGIENAQKEEGQTEGQENAAAPIAARHSQKQSKKTKAHISKGVWRLEPYGHDQVLAVTAEGVFLFSVEDGAIVARLSVSRFSPDLVATDAEHSFIVAAGVANFSSADAAKDAGKPATAQTERVQYCVAVYRKNKQILCKGLSIIPRAIVIDKSRFSPSNAPAIIVLGNNADYEVIDVPSLSSDDTGEIEGSSTTTASAATASATTASAITASATTASTKSSKHRSRA